MGRVHLVVEIDAEVYPELHAALAALGNDGTRGERLRQLAASGLVWEHLRRSAAAQAVASAWPASPRSSGAAAVPAVQAATTAAPAPVEAATVAPLPPAPDPVAAPPERVAAAPRMATPAARAAPPRTAAVDDFVDLALDAERTPRTSSPARLPPTLVDVIAPPASAAAGPDASRQAASVVPHGEAAPKVSQVDSGDALPEPSAVATADANADTHAATRLRLQRMKDRGLFRNG